MTSISNDLAAFEGNPRRDVKMHAATVMPQLLISVRDRGEMEEALALGVDIVDLKEPRRGPLAPADIGLWQHAASLWNAFSVPDAPPVRRPKLSAALGERPDALRVASRLPGQFAFAKVGPHRCEDAASIRELWDEVRQLLDPRIELVAVAYADHDNAQCLHPEKVFRLAIEAGFRRGLIDTFTKDGTSTVDHVGVEGLSRLAGVSRDAGLWWTLAGSIQVDAVRPLRQAGLEPDCFGVRGDVCQKGRTGTLSSDRVRVWQDLLSHRG